MEEELDLSSEEATEGTELWCENTAFQGDKKQTCKEILEN